MRTTRTDMMLRFGFAVAAMTFIGAFASAQENADEDEVIDEIIVVAGEKSGDPVDVDALYEEMMRERLMLDQIRLQELQEEDEWRSSASLAVDSPSRIMWGYDQQDELRMRRESNISELTWVPTKPATVFRAEF